MINLPKVKGKYKLNYNLAHLTWFKVGGNADILFKPQDEEDLASFIKENSRILPLNILGAGSNTIIRDNGIDGVVVKLGNNFTNIKLLNDGNLEVGAACLNFNLAKFSQQHSIKNFEFLIGIPGTVGGGVAMNAGSYNSEFKDIVSSVSAIDKYGNTITIRNKDIGFSYRKNSLPKDFIITKVVFKADRGNNIDIKNKMDKINKERSLTQPITEKTGGSTFANPQGHKAWKLIEEAGLRGKRIGDASISLKHCNFIINNGDAKASDIEDLGNFVKNEVLKHSGVELRWEIKIIGRKNEEF